MTEQDKVDEQTIRQGLYLQALADLDETGTVLNENDLRQTAQQHRDFKKPIPFFRAVVPSLITRLQTRKHVDVQPYSAARGKTWAFAALPIIFIVGLFSNYLDPDQQVNLVLNPVVALLLWNLALYLLLPFLFFSKKKGPGMVAGFFYRLGGRLNRGMLKRLPVTSERYRPLLVAAALKSRLLWEAAAPEMVRRRTAVFFHLAGAMLAIGVISGLYVRGLVADYRFEWGSTFIENGDTLLWYLNRLYAPIILLHGPLPPLEGQNGAAWIHFFAIALTLVVIIPRLLLVLYNAIHLLRLKGHLPVPYKAPFFAKWRTFAGPIGSKTRLISYSYTLDSEKLRVLREIYRMLSGRQPVDEPLALEWGDPPPSGPSEADADLVCFNAAQTPEIEVQGEFLSDLGKDREIMAALDTSRLSDENDASRKEAWRLVLEQAGVQHFLWLDLGRSSGRYDKEALDKVIQGTHLEP